MMVRVATTIARSGSSFVKNAFKVGFGAKPKGREVKFVSSFLPKTAFPLPSRQRWSYGRSNVSVRVVNVAAAPLERRPIEAPKEAHGFELIRHEYVKEYDSDVLVYVHKKTGAELLSVVNDDENKCFGVSFRTPVDDSMGVPHILEHSVLCGSRKYNLKEPFVELIKGSLNTFLNAMTYPDRTLYPVASCNLQDFYNLVDVYLDAVFFPNCVRDPQIFAQEGWHYEIDEENQPLTYKGVVFNEMKGVFSSPDSVNMMKGFRSCFPQNTYNFESGGDPIHIPNLTFEQFKEFHGTYYHPSNAKIWFSGDDDPIKRLEILNDYLDQFSKKEVNSAIEPQPLFNEPKKIVEPFAAGETDKNFVSLNWVLSEEPLDIKTQLSIAFLNYLLLGTSAAPLYKRLIDSDLGETVTGGGLEDSIRQPLFSIGLKGVDSANVGNVENVIMEELRRLEKEGFTSNAIDAAMNTIEFSLRENNTGRLPRGLSLLFRIMDAWNYERDPIEHLKWEEPLKDLKKQLARGEDVFRPLLRRYFLENNHRVTLELRPDSELESKMKRTEEEKLSKIKSGMSTTEIQEQVKLTEALKRRQETPDSPEALKCLPTLKLSDIPKETTKIPTEVQQEGSTTFLTHDLFTNDILYFTLAMDMGTLPSELLPMVPLFCESLTEMGTQKNDFVELTELIGRKTGGLDVSYWVSDKRGSENPVAKIMITGKATKDKIGDMMEIAQEILLLPKLDNKERFKQMVLETKSGLESAISSGGNRFVMRRLAAQACQADAVSEQMSGIAYLSFIRDLVDRIDRDWESVLRQLEQCRKFLIQSANSIVNFTADERTMDRAKPIVDNLLSALPSVQHPQQRWDVLLPAENEVFTIPTQVNYIGKGLHLYRDTDYQYSGSSTVIEKHLFATWLWERVRVTGGAYGCHAQLDPQSGFFEFCSYRDPNLMETVSIYDKTSEFLKTIQLDDDALTKAIIGAIGSVDAYMLPDAKGHTAMIRHFLGITDEWRQARRDELLSTSAKDFVEFGKTLEALQTDKAKVAAVTSLEKAEAVNKANPGFWKIQKIL